MVVGVCVGVEGKVVKYIATSAIAINAIIPKTGPVRIDVLEQVFKTFTKHPFRMIYI